MPVPSIPLSRSQKTDLESICSYDIEKIKAIADAIGDMSTTIKRTNIRAAISEHLDSVSTKTLVRFLFATITSFRDRHLRLENFSETLHLSVSESGSDNLKQKWPDYSKYICKLISSPSLYLSAKALSLSFDFERVYLSGRIITGLRPIYSDKRDIIHGSTVTQTMRLEFVDSGGHRTSISLALDSEDIEKLKETCEFALNKGRVMKEKLGPVLGKEIFDLGEDE